ncbi:MAG: hypothetical protein AAB864_00700 [Patescibacteria group bacterium]
MEPQYTPPGPPSPAPMPVIPPVPPTRWGMLAGILVGAVILGAGAYFLLKVPVIAPAYTPSPSPSTVPSDWKTYTNATYGFEFKYPSTAKIVGPVPTVSSGFSVEINYEGREGYEPPRLEISTLKDTRSNIQYVNTNTFMGNEGENPIQFVSNGRTMYANCVNYSKDPVVMSFCNQILSTFRFTR